MRKIRARVPRLVVAISVVVALALIGCVHHHKVSIEPIHMHVDVTVESADDGGDSDNRRR